jgi:hypothetical protein
MSARHLVRASKVCPTLPVMPRHDANLELPGGCPAGTTLKPCRTRTPFALLLVLHGVREATHRVGHMLTLARLGPTVAGSASLLS